MSRQAADELDLEPGQTPTAVVTSTIVVVVEQLLTVHPLEMLAEPAQRRGLVILTFTTPVT